MKGGANAAWITGRLRRRVRRKKYGDRAQNRRSGAPGGARAGQTARGTARCRLEKVRLLALRSPRAHVRDKGKEGAAPRLTAKGADESRLYEPHVRAWVDAARPQSYRNAPPC